MSVSINLDIPLSPALRELAPWRASLICLSLWERRHGVSRDREGLNCCDILRLLLAVNFRNLDYLHYALFHVICTGVFHTAVEVVTSGTEVGARQSHE